MPKITQDDAVRIADKLLAVYKMGGKHKLAMIYFQGKKILQFGIRHDRTAGHDYVADQIFMSKSDCVIFGECKITYDEWVARMRIKGIISSEPEPPDETRKVKRRRHG